MSNNSFTYQVNLKIDGEDIIGTITASVKKMTTIYVEPFFGGGAVFWAKQSTRAEIINDFNANVVNFYEVLKSDFERLKSFIEKTIISREAYKSALVIYHSPFLFSPVQRAWAFWYATNGAFPTKSKIAVL